MRISKDNKHGNAAINADIPSAEITHKTYRPGYLVNIAGESHARVEASSALRGVFGKIGPRWCVSLSFAEVEKAYHEMLAIQREREAPIASPDLSKAVLATKPKQAIYPGDTLIECAF
jgi:hypothetical protein